MKIDYFEDEFINGIMPRDRIKRIYYYKYNDKWKVYVDYGDGNWSSTYDTEEEAIKKRDILIAKYKQGGITMVQEIKTTIEDFFKDNKSLITWIAILFLADHFFFYGKFRSRLHGMVDNIINKTEKKIEAIK